MIIILVQTQRYGVGRWSSGLSSNAATNLLALPADLRMNGNWSPACKGVCVNASVRRC